MDADAIRGWIQRAEAEVRELTRKQEAIQAELGQARRQLMLYYEMLATATNAPVPVASEGMGLAHSTRERVWAQAEEVLRAHGKPMRIQDIHAEFVRRGFQLPGRGTPTNIVAHLVASNQFSRPGRGVYGLVEWDRPSRSTRTASSTEPAGAVDTARAHSSAGSLARSS